MVRSYSKKGVDRLRAQVDEYIKNQGNNTYNYKQVAHAIGASSPINQRAVALYLAELAFDGDILETAPGRYKSPSRSSYATGTFVRRSNGKNSVIIDDDDEAIFVAERNSMHALNGDRVSVNIAARRRGAEPEAEVVEILERKPQIFIGTLKVDKHFAYLLTDSKYLASDIFIPKSKLKGGVTGDKAVARITEWTDDTKNPKGEIVDILGKKGENNAEINAIMAEFGLPYIYPESVDKAAGKIDAGIT
ncbi:MAG: ribonuclease R, partial [Muribaculaceae bacterium]|nr:ribonuclease R [Muribaculaceae bacterium]